MLKKILFKLIKNSRFGYDCRNNIDNCTFEQICDELEEIFYLKKYENIFDQSISVFVNSETLESGIEKDFNEKIKNIKDDRFREAQINSLQIKRSNNLEVCRLLKEQEKIKKTKIYKKIK